MTSVELTCTAIAVGGEAVARDDDGRVVFVEGGLPGEQVRVEIADERKRFARGHVVEVLQPSPDRITPPCPHVAAGCGGCGWQHVEHRPQRELKREMVTEALTRLGGIEQVVVEPGPDLVDRGFRTTLRLSVLGGEVGFRRAHSHDTVPVDSCLVAHPLLAELVADGRFDNCREVTLRAGAGTGERLVLVDGDPAGVHVPDDVLVVGTRDVRRGRHAWIHEVAAGRTWRISATSFFQTRDDGASALVETAAGQVARAVGALDPARGSRALVDLCCGVGLFAGGLAAPLAALGVGDWHVLGVERHRPAVADARHNLADLGGAKLVRASFDGWRASRADVVVADPARAGLGKPGVAAVVAAAAPIVVLVSCDPGSLGRDAGLLRHEGYRLAETSLVDLFPHTPHVEVVSTFVR